MENLKLAGVMFGALLLFIVGVKSCQASPRVALPVDISTERKSDRLPIVIATAAAALLVATDERGVFRVRQQPTPRPQIRKDAVMAIIEWNW